jgi:hypothetical protein
MRKAVIKLNYKIILSSLLLFLLNTSLNGQNQKYAAWSISTVRPLSMGGAFTSVNDDIAAALYNPAAFSLYEEQKTFKTTILLNPGAMLSAYRYYSDDFQKNVSPMQVVRGAATAVKAIFFTTINFNAGMIFNEKSVAASFHSNDLFIINPNQFWTNSTGIFFANFKIARRAALGVSGSYYYNPDEKIQKNRFGFSYGIFIKPHDRLNVGLSYIDLSETASDIRTPFERIADETMNVGVSFYPFNSTIISLDVRNLTEETVKNNREIHIGLEQQIFSIASFRAGAYQERNTNRNFYSAGIGLIDSNLLFHRENRFIHRQYMMNYAVILNEDKVKNATYYHLLSFLVRF